LVHEAGGLMTDFAGRPLSFNRPHVVHGALIAAGPARHGTILGLVRDRMPEFA
jgi:myo-inositol-1(or 4)-monophosphatase